MVRNNFRTVLGAVTILGLSIGVAFGAGVAYGHSDSKEATTGLTQQQITSLITGGGAQTAGGQGTQPSGAPAARGNFQGGAVPGLDNNTTGQITSITDSTITVQTAQASVKVNIGNNVKPNVFRTGSTSDLKIGDSIVVAGTSKEDASVDATSISQVPSELTGGGGGAVGQGPAPGATRTP